MQVLVNGLVSGSTIALLALAFAVVYVPTRVFHIALAGVYSLAPFLTVSLLEAGVPWFMCLLIVIPAGAAISFACEWLNHNRLERRGAGPGLHLVSSLGIFIIIVQAVSMVWGNEVRTLRQGIDSVFSVGGIHMTRAQIIAGGTVFSVVLLFYLWLQFSNLGLRFRALADNSVQLALFGYNVRKLRLLSFSIAGVFASIASLVVAFDVGFDPHGGLNALLLGVIAVIIGGRGSFLGPVLAGFLLGIIRAEIVWYASARWQDTATYLLLVFFLFLRPQGLIGKELRLEAQP